MRKADGNIEERDVSIYDIKRKAAARCRGKRQYLTAVNTAADGGFILSAAVFSALWAGGALNGLKVSVIVIIAAAAVAALIIKIMFAPLKNRAYFAVIQMKPQARQKGFGYAAYTVKVLAVIAAVPFLLFPAAIAQAAFLNAENYTTGTVSERLKRSAAESRGLKGKAAALLLSEIPWLLLAVLAAAGVYNIIEKLYFGAVAAALTAAAGAIITAIFLEYRYCVYRSSLIMLINGENEKGGQQKTEADADK